MNILRTLLFSAILGVVSALSLVLTSSAINCPDPNDDKAVEFCSHNFRLTGSGIGAINGRMTDASNASVNHPRLPEAGKLSFADMVNIESEAAQSLKRNKDFRETISPFQGKQGFKDLVINFDTVGGFTAPAGGTTLQDKLNQADIELRKARNLYAYLAVYATGNDYETRFRVRLGAACTAKEDVVNNSFDRCNFAARMRESIREIAYLRMIFGQQFTADALGLNFSAQLVGGEKMVRSEITKLEMATTQFQYARDAVSEGMHVALGNGCFIYDFYTEQEWSLLFRAVEGLERAQHQIAIRKSYLGGDDNGFGAAQAIYRSSAVAHYVQLIGGTGLWSKQQHNALCASPSATRPDSNLVAEMVTSLLDTTHDAHGLREGRNAFGFAIHFTPARPYYTSRNPDGSENTGLWDQAMRAAEEARTVQGQAEIARRLFDEDKTALMQAIENIRGKYFTRLRDLTSCRLEDFGNDSELTLACAEAASVKLEQCHTASSEIDFAACVANVPTGLLREAWNRLRTAHLRINRVQASINAIPRRAQIEIDTNATINDEILTNGREQSVIQFISAQLESVSVSGGFPAGISFSHNPFSPFIGKLRSDSTMRQAISEVHINSLRSDAEVRKLLVELTELQIDLQITAQEFNAQLTEFQTLAAETKDLTIETRRAVNYNINNNPANDPSFRLVRDGLRLDLAANLSRAARLSYLAARRAEYEYAKAISGLACLSTEKFLMSKIYQARTANDIISFLNCLQDVTNGLPAGVTESETTPEDFTLSIAKHVLSLTDQNLGLTGDAARNERIRRFRAWVAENTYIGTNGKPVLIFHFSTSLVNNGIFANVLQESFPTMWLQKMSGLGSPWPTNTGFSVNLLSSQTGNPGLVYRDIYVTQGGLLHIRAQNGCIFDYRLIHPGALLGLKWPESLSPEQVTAQFRASVNNSTGVSTPAFFRRPVSASDWQVEIRSGSPDGVLSDMDLQQLNDIELKFSTTRASTVAALNPKPADCSRIDY